MNDGKNHGFRLRCSQQNQPNDNMVLIQVGVLWLIQIM